MRLFIAGTRGTAPVTARGHAIFGGDTTCLLVTGSRGERVVLDGGSGLPALAGRLGEAPDLLMLLTHFHLDHLMGLPAFAPLYDPRTTLRIAAAKADGHTCEAALRGLMDAPYWPIGLDRLPASLAFTDLPPSSGSEPMRAGGLEIRWAPLPHPGGCTAFRIDEPATKASLVMATDAEWDGADDSLLDGFSELCRHPAPCGLLICDGQYDRDTIASRRGWGHTSWPRAVQLARDVKAARLLLTHHDPEHDDRVLAARERAVRADLPSAALARQGQEIDLARKDPA